MRIVRAFALHFVSLEKRGPLRADLEAAAWPVTALDVGPGLHPGLVVRWLVYSARVGPTPFTRTTSAP